MSVPPITNTASNTASSSSAASNTLLTATDFMTLLVSQLKNQDPTQPMDPNQFMDQLVGFNSLQTQLGMKQDLDTLAAAVAAVSTGNTSTSGTDGANNGSTNTGTTGLP